MSESVSIQMKGKTENGCKQEHQQEGADINRFTQYCIMKMPDEKKRKKADKPPERKEV